ncbi:MAG: hypothetical protein GEV11_28930, partial [Streptosporangiales bacterium]|nr:hypothetical protein [Streptosporangiales bacterium]
MRMPSDVRGSFPAEPSAPAAARRLVRRALTGWGAGEAVADVGSEAELLTCELVTNAIVHAGSGVQVVCAYDPHVPALNGDSGPHPPTAGLRVEITDNRPDLAVGYTGARARRRTATDLTGGRGLMLTAEMAEEWGVTYRSTSKTVWFRLALPTLPTLAPPARTAPAHATPAETAVLAAPAPATPAETAALAAPAQATAAQTAALAAPALAAPALAAPALAAPALAAPALAAPALAMRAESTPAQPTALAASAQPAPALAAS